MSHANDRVFGLVSSPDAALLKLLRDIQAAERSYISLSQLLDQRDIEHPRREQTIRKIGAIIDRVNQLACNACALPARTEAGRIAKARLFQKWNTFLNDDGSLKPDVPMPVRIAHSLALDLAGLTPARIAV